MLIVSRNFSYMRVNTVDAFLMKWEQKNRHVHTRYNYIITFLRSTLNHIYRVFLPFVVIVSCKKKNKNEKKRPLPLSIDGCTVSINIIDIIWINLTLGVISSNRSVVKSENSIPTWRARVCEKIKRWFTWARGKEEKKKEERPCERGAWIVRDS